MTFMTNDLHDTRFGYAIARCQAKTTLKSYWHELRDHQEYSKKIAMKMGQVLGYDDCYDSGQSPCDMFRTAISTISSSRSLIHPYAQSV